MDCKEFPNHYKVSNFGNVKTKPRYVSNHTGKLLVKEKILKQRKSKKGYKVVDLSVNSKKYYRQVHRLVAETFIQNPENKPQVNHKDGNKENNNVSNLEWVTNQENQLHAVKYGLNDHSKYESGRKKRPVLQIDLKTKEVIAEYPSIAEASVSIGYCNKSNIGMCCRGERNKVGGYGWKFKESVVM